ncbi:MAG: hypothetical protein KGH67_02900 [Candidatus Micrarchaeota archaeon]|nr:hypothetical protein [Candidatus Micrarchaeota archaeon]MDE1859452.1 hypothetical protein [Candidatus Micrarchaeota archaeon]
MEAAQAGTKTGEAMEKAPIHPSPQNRIQKVENLLMSGHAAYVANAAMASIPDGFDSHKFKPFYNRLRRKCSIITDAFCHCKQQEIKIVKLTARASKMPNKP